MSLDHYVYSHGSELFCVKACPNQDSLDLIAISDAHSITVLSYTAEPPACDVLATFYIGAQATAIAWSPRSSSPRSASAYQLELVVSSFDDILYHLYKDEQLSERVSPIRSDNYVSHSQPISDLQFCGDHSGGSGWRYLASVADDKMLIIWDIFPDSVDRPEMDEESSASPVPRSLLPPGKAETWCLPFENILHSAAVHADNSKNLLVADTCGSVYLVEWKSCCTPGSDKAQAVLMEYIEPRSLSQVIFSPEPSWSGSVSWKFDDENIIAAAFEDRWAVWEQTNGSRPIATGSTFPGGVSRLRWCPTDLKLFAISPQSFNHGAVLHIHNIGFLSSPPSIFQVSGTPHRISDFDWLGITLKKAPVVAVAIEKSLHILRTGENLDDGS